MRFLHRKALKDVRYRGRTSHIKLVFSMNDCRNLTRFEFFFFFLSFKNCFYHSVWKVMTFHVDGKCSRWYQQCIWILYFLTSLNNSIHGDGRSVLRAFDSMPSMMNIIFLLLLLYFGKKKLLNRIEGNKSWICFIKQRSPRHFHWFIAVALTGKNWMIGCRPTFDNLILCQFINVWERWIAVKIN